MILRACLFWVLLFTSAAPCHATSVVGEPSTREEFEKFWEDFGKALASVDPKELLPMVEFPFTSRGNMDFDPELTYTPETFKRALPMLLASDVGTTELPTPMSEYLKQKMTFSDSDILAGEVRVGNFKFHKVKGAWKWYHAYYDTSPTP